MKFAAFLLESKHKQSIDTEEAIEIAKNYCSNAIKNGIELYRGGNFNDDAYLMDSSKTIRRSANTSNHYTIVMDHLIKDENYPLRSKSFIMAAEDYIAGGYGSSRRRIIPFDDAKIGTAKQDDLWYVSLNTKILKYFTFEDFAAMFNSLDAPDTSYEKLLSFIVELLDKLIKRQEKDPDDISRSEEEFLKMFDGVKPTNADVEARLKDIFDPKKIGLEFFTGATATDKNLKGECWLSGKALAVTDEIYDEIVKALK